MRVGEARKPGPGPDPFSEDFDCGLFDSLGCADDHRFESFWLDRDDAPEGPEEDEESGGLGGVEVMADPPSYIKALPSRGRLGISSGSKAGMVFRLGHLGLGYYIDRYIDTPVEAAAVQDRSVAVVELELDELVPADDPPVQLQLDTTHPTSANAVAAKPPKIIGVRRGKRRGARGIVSVLDGPWESDSLFWPLNQHVPINDLSHRDQGWWTVEAVNPNAWPAAREYMHRTSADVVLVAETKVPAQETALAEQVARGDKWNVALQPCVVSAVGGRSSGVAVGVRKHIGLSMPTSFEAAEHYQMPGRFTLRRIGAICKGGVHVGSVYLKDTIGVHAQHNLDTLHGMMLALKAVRGPWCVGGDWNCTPEELEATGWLKLVGGVIKAPPTPTCNGRVIDFFVVSSSLDHAALMVRAVSDARLIHCTSRRMPGCAWSGS